MATIRKRLAARSVGTAILGISVLSASGCLIQSTSSSSFAGNRVTKQSLTRLEKGESTEEFVLATVGAADEQQELSDGSILWKYTWTEKRQSSGAVFLLFGGSSSTSRDGKAFIRFDDGIVQDFWID